MPWMRIAIGVGGGGLVAGVTGMAVWIDERSNYFGVAVALASAGFLTLVACVLTRVFGSSHGSQDDAFRRGREMGYDAGFLEGHRTARPVVVPMRAADPDPETPPSEVDDVPELDTPSTMPLWGRDAMPVRGRNARREARDRVVAWVGAQRIPLLAGALCLAMLGVLAANAAVPTPTPTEALQQSFGLQPDPAVPLSAETPALVSKPGHAAWSVAVGADGILAVPAMAGVSAVEPSAAGVAQVVPASGASVGAAAVQPVAAASSLPGVALVAPATVYLPAAPSPAPTPAVAPVPAAPAVPLTAAEQTAADALAAANLTQANALAAANLTAANAAAAAAETARVAAAAAEATRLQALADAYAVAHPGG
jgi:hypothetical protein